ncbi:hypothetical protein LSH36_1069g00052 [Paralvinella palmiformis]|uniref:Endonuclease V n=1 Tax=Paralvinella palmiformis TaxID=53620 RepID=A0AAD9MRM8_9ANNE|nr:hypothetical protein LSH36_1069g00052 [Paralvinella palmiformis]
MFFRHLFSVVRKTAVCVAMEASNATASVECKTHNSPPSVEEVLKMKWEREQKDLKEKMLLMDVDDWSKLKITTDVVNKFPQKLCLRYVGGVDISFIKGDDVNACAAFVVLEFPELKIIYKDISMVQLTAPYIPGFLAFREVNSLKEKIEKLKNIQPSILPQVVLVDGNGILHPRGFGLACHLGVLTDLPTIGVAKNLFCVKKLQDAGDWLPLIGISGKQHGVIYRSCKESTNPIYISPGHKISMETAIWVVEKCINYRIPEPTRQADILSREYIRSLCNKGESDKKPSHKKKKRERGQKRNEFDNPMPSETCEDESYLGPGLDLWDS